MTQQISDSEMKFIVWLSEVDQAVWLVAGCSVHDLADTLLRDWYIDGATPGEAADRAIEENLPEFFEEPDPVSILDSCIPVMFW